MGCSQRKIKTDDERNNILKKIKEKITTLIKKNPFYSVSTKNFDKSLKKIVEENTNNNIENICNSLITVYFGSSTRLIKKQFIDVIKFSSTKFKLLFPKDKEINIIIFSLLHFFLSEHSEDDKKYMQKIILELLNKISIQNNNSDEKQFNKGKFSCLILNIIQLCTFSFIYMFCGQTILEIVCNLGRFTIEDLFMKNLTKKSEDQKKIKTINELFNINLRTVNKCLKRDYVYSIVLAEVLEPINEYIIEDNEKEKEFNIDQEILNDIVRLLIQKMNLYYFLELFFGENSD